MKKLQRGIGVILLLTGIILFLEGGFHLSVIQYDDFEKITSSNSDILFPSIAENTTKEDVIVSVNYDRETENTVHILEYSKNTVWDCYSLTAVHKCNIETSQFRSVVSSAIFDYPYKVDLESMSIEIYDGSISRNLILAIFAFTIGLLNFLYSYAQRRS